jgi:hypothetical protein
VSCDQAVGLLESNPGSLGSPAATPCFAVAEAPINQPLTTVWAGAPCMPARMNQAMKGTIRMEAVIATAKVIIISR